MCIVNNLVEFPVTQKIKLINIIDTYSAYIPVYIQKLCLHIFWSRISGQSIYEISMRRLTVHV